MALERHDNLCPRCVVVGCFGNQSQHANWYLNPTSPTRLRGSSRTETGAWCECCLGRLWGVLKPQAKEFLLLLAETPDVLVDLTFTKGHKQAVTLDICWGVKRLGIGVEYATGVVQGALATPNAKWGLPFAYDELMRPWKWYFLPATGAELVNKFAEQG